MRYMARWEHAYAKVNSIRRELSTLSDQIWEARTALIRAASDEIDLSDLDE